MKERAKTSSQGRELLLLVIASVIGIYSLGQGLQGVFFPGQGVSLIWLAVAGAAMWVLFLQMGRVKDTWPPRLEQTKTGQEMPGQAEEGRKETENV